MDEAELLEIIRSLLGFAENWAEHVKANTTYYRGIMSHIERAKALFPEEDGECSTKQ